MTELENKIKEEWEKYQNQNLNKLYPNILVLGISGAGKSSLINTVFGKTIAPVSDVKPETVGFNLYKGEEYGLNVNLIDSAGYEMSQSGSYYNVVKNILDNGIEDLKKIHVIWYCLSITNERIEDIDIKTLIALYKEDSIRKRVCVVFTKCDYDDNNSTKANKLKNILKEEFESVNINFDLKCFETSNDKSMELELKELIERSASQIDDKDLRNMFVASQMVDLKAKEKAAEDIIKVSSTMAGIAAATPIKISDAAILVPIQIKMINDIINVYGLKNIISLKSGVIVELVMPNFGKYIAKLIISFIPVIGQIVGAVTSVINVSVASSLTYALGMAVSYVCKDSLIKALKGEHVIWENLLDLEQLLPIIKKFMDKENQNK